MRRIGYARVSTGDEQTTQMQIDALKRAGCDVIHEEIASGGDFTRPVLHQMMSELQPDDLVVVWKLDRLSRSLRDLLALLETIEEAGASFLSLTENIDTSSAGGRMMMHIVGAFAEFERSMIRERTRAGIAAARERGVKHGRPSRFSEEEREAVCQKIREGQMTQREAAKDLGVHYNTVGRWMRKDEN